jgi:hypothetical protein
MRGTHRCMQIAVTGMFRSNALICAQRDLRRLPPVPAAVGSRSRLFDAMQQPLWAYNDRQME